MNDLPTREQLLKDPIREKFVFLTSEKHPQTCIGLTDKTDFHGVVYKYGKVSLGEETKDGNLPFRFEYDILDNNMIPREEFDDENFFNLLGDILVDIIDRQENLNIGYTNDRENNSQ